MQSTEHRTLRTYIKKYSHVHPPSIATVISCERDQLKKSVTTLLCRGGMRNCPVKKGGNSDVENPIISKIQFPGTKIYHDWTLVFTQLTKLDKCVQQDSYFGTA